MPKKQMSSPAKFEKEFIGTMMMPFDQKPKTYSLIEPTTMTKIESMIEKRVDGERCTNCGYTTRRTGHMREHVEKHIEGLEYPCHSCNKIMMSSHSFRDHKRKFCPSLNSFKKIKELGFQDQLRLSFSHKRLPIKTSELVETVLKQNNRKNDTFIKPLK